MGSPSKNKYLPRSHVRFQSVTQVNARETGNPRRRCESREPSTSRYIGCPVCATVGADVPAGGAVGWGLPSAGADGASARGGGCCRPIRPLALSLTDALAGRVEALGGRRGRMLSWRPGPCMLPPLEAPADDGAACAGRRPSLRGPTSRSRGAAVGRRFPDSSGSRRRCWSHHCPRRYPTTSRRR